MKKIVLMLAMVLLMTATVMTGCSGGGIAQDVYDQVASQLQQAQDKAAEYQQQMAEAQQAGAAAEAALAEAQAQIAALEGQLGEYELAGGTKAEIAAKIVRNYHETHVYSKTDQFICGDMSSEVWNMLKAQGISAVIVVGNKDMKVDDILQSNHAWVLAEVEPGQYLALETTSGNVMPRSEPKNALYYTGWSFASPTTLKDNNNLVREYNTRVEVYNDIVIEAQAVAKAHNAATDPTTADNLKAVYDKLTEILNAQQAELGRIEGEINGLATSL